MNLGDKNIQSITLLDNTCLSSACWVPDAGVSNKNQMGAIVSAFPVQQVGHSALEFTN